MPQPHEQKLQEVVNSLTFDSFMSAVAARMARTSRSPPSASPDPPARVSLNRSRRLIDDFRDGAQGDGSMPSLRSMCREPEAGGSSMQILLLVPHRINPLDLRV